MKAEGKVVVLQLFLIQFLSKQTENDVKKLKLEVKEKGGRDSLLFFIHWLKGLRRALSLAATETSQ